MRPPLFLGSSDETGPCGMEGLSFGGGAFLIAVPSSASSLAQCALAPFCPELLGCILSCWDVY